MFDRVVDRSRGARHQQSSSLKLRRELAGSNEGRGLLADLGAGEHLTLSGDVLQPVGEGPFGCSERRRREVVGERRPEGKFEERRRVDRGSGCPAGADVPRVDAAVVGNEGVIDDQRVRAGAAHPYGAPVVIDRVVVAREKTPTQVGRLVRALRWDDDAHHRPRAVVRSARPRPPAADAIAAFDSLALAFARCERRRHHRVGIVTPHLLLHLGRKQADQPKVTGDEAEHPTGGGVTLRDFGDHLDCRLGAELGTAPPLRLVQAHEAAGDELLHCHVGYAPERLGLGTSLHETGGQLPCPG